MEKTSNKFITFYKKFGIYVFLAAVVIIFSIIAPNFLSVANLINILRQVSIFGIVVIGVTMVMIGGGMDLSVGGIMAVVGMVMGYCMVNVGLPIPVAVIIGIALGVAFGAINVVVAIKLHIAPIIVTLAMMLVLQGVYAESIFDSRTGIYRTGSDSGYSVCDLHRIWLDCHEQDIPWQKYLCTWRKQRSSQTCRYQCQ